MWISVKSTYVSIILFCLFFRSVNDDAQNGLQSKSTGSTEHQVYAGFSYVSL